VRARTFGELVEYATAQLVHYGMGDPFSREALRRFAASLQRLDLDPDDRVRIDELVDAVGAAALFDDM
jgi:hypothetical protein